MAYDGEWENFFDFLAEEIKNQTRIRDYLSAEKVVQGFLLAYLNICDYYAVSPERELNKKIADFFLEPFLAKYPDLPRAYVIELKYLKRGKSDELPAEESVKAKVEEAKGQLAKYLGDSPLQRQYGSVKITGLVLVFHGWELIHREAVRPR